MKLNKILLVLLIMCIAFSLVGCLRNNKPSESTVEIKQPDDDELYKRIAEIVNEANKRYKIGKLDEGYALYQIIKKLESILPIEDFYKDNLLGLAIVRYGGVKDGAIHELFDLTLSSIQWVYKKPKDVEAALELTEEMLEFVNSAVDIADKYSLVNIVNILEYELDDIQNKEQIAK